MIPIFDSLCHPRFDGKWPCRVKLDASFDTLLKEMKKHGIRKCCAVSSFNDKGYTHRRFFRIAARHEGLFPVAALQSVKGDWNKEIEEIANIGFTSIKIHPRSLGINLCDPLMIQILRKCDELNLRVFLCSYFYGPAKSMGTSDPFFALISIVQKLPNLRIILLHGGDVELLRYAQLTRHNPNILLDLSHTLTKYAGSSLDLDLHYLFNAFDQRICIGSDHPEWSLLELRTRFEEFAGVIKDSDKLQRIAHDNLENFLRFK